MSSFCGNCCTDLNIKLQELAFPTAFLDDAGLNFYRTHGLDACMKPTDNVTFVYNGIAYHISILGLIRPDLYLDEAGQRFHAEHGLDALVRDNVTVRLLHRCQHLQPDRSCGIYEARPDVCRAFDCSHRDDCVLAALSQE